MVVESGDRANVNKKQSPDGTEEETRNLMFCLVLNRIVNVNCNNTLLTIDKCY